MRRAQRNGSTYFIAEYEDGSKAYFGIDPAILQNDDQIALAIANERQRKGTLKRGNIIRAYKPSPNWT
jgi:hypothetical protein